jgi:hypothetical protein
MVCEKVESVSENNPESYGSKLLENITVDLHLRVAVILRDGGRVLVDALVRECRLLTEKASVNSNSVSENGSSVILHGNVTEKSKVMNRLSVLERTSV